ncbi:MAG: GC-type dockerin domain-anchored protein [Phycisphaerales bacterium]
MMHTRTVIGIVGILALCGTTAGAQDIDWLNPADGDWNNPINWENGNIPDSTLETAILGWGSAYTVTVADANATVGGLVVSNPLATLVVSNELGQRYLYVSGGVMNDGLIRVIDNGTSSNAYFWSQTDTTIGGAGVVELFVEDGSSLSDVQLYPGSATTLTIGGDQTVRGSGQIGGQGVVVNNGTIDPGSGEGSLQLTGMHAMGSGVYASSAGILDLYNASMTGVTFDNSGAGWVGALASNPTLTDVMNLGTLEITNEIGQRIMYVNNTLTNDGSIRIVDNGSSSNAYLWSQTDTTIAGDGVVELFVEDGSGLNDAQLYPGSATTLTIGAGQTVRGTGQIGGQGVVLNNGTIDPGSDTSLLRLNGVHAMGAGVYASSAGTLDLYSANMTGVMFDSSGTGRVGAFESNPTLTDVMNIGTLEVSNANGQRIMYINNTVTNDGLIRLVDNDSNGDAYLWSQSDTTIGGTGVVELLVEEGSTLNDAQLYPGSATTLTIGAGQIVRGTGQIGGQGTIVNNGTIDPGSETGLLRLTGVHADGLGMYAASAGTLDLYSAMISNVTFGSSGDGRVGAYESNPTLTDVTNTGTLEVSNENSQRILYVNNTITNNGVIRIVDDGSGSNAHVWSQSDTTIAGIGVIELFVEDGSNLNDAQLYPGSATTLTIGAGQAVRGSGQIGGQGTIVNNGSIEPGGLQREFSVNSPVVCGPGSGMVFNIGGTNPGEHDVITLTSTIAIDGTITVEFDDGYAPAFGDRWTLIDGGTQSGEFQDLVVIDPPAGQVFRVFTNPDETYVILTCDADLSGDGGIDFFDVSTFLSYFSAQDVRGDLNGDGLFDFFDVSTFLQIYGQGCDL